MKALIRLLTICLILAVFTSCTQYNYKYEVKIIYMNGDVEVLEVEQESGKRPFLWADDGDLFLRNKGGRKHVASGVRRYELISESRNDISDENDLR